MIDTTQVLLVASITVMTIILTIIGVQLIFVLRDLRRLLGKFNIIIDEVERVGTNMGNSFSEITGFVSGFKKIMFLVDLLAKKKKAKKNSEK